MKNKNISISTGSGGNVQLTKNQFGLLILRDIFDKYGDQTVSYDNLNKEIQLKIKDIEIGEVKRFKDAAGLPLQDFLKHNKDIFEIHFKKKKRYIKMNRKCTSKHLFKPTESGTEACYSSWSKDSNNADQFDASSDLEDTVDGHNEWIVVTRNKRKSPTVPTADYLSDENTKTFYEWTDGFDLFKFRSLICLAADRDHGFIPSAEVYKNNKFRFMQDIVSMWNTPQRTCSYIILGVCEKTKPPHNLVGVVGAENDTFYQRLFHDDYFTMRPNFKYYHVSFEGKQYGVIKIWSSHGCGLPSIVKKGGNLSGVTLKENQLWFRKGPQNQVCKPTDPTTGNIYQWFMGTVNRRGSPTTVSTRLIVTNSTRNAETCTDLPEYESCDSIRGDFDAFWKSVQAFSKGHFILVSGDISNTTKRLEALTLVPWIAVYDFDILSHSDGLLNATMDFIERRRSLHINTWKDPAQFITEQSTSWCFMRGRREISESRTDEKDGTIEDANLWLRTTKRGIDSNCEQLANFSDDYTVLTVVLFWPVKERLIPIMQRFVLRLFEHLSVPPNIVLCLSKDPCTEKGRCRFDMFCDDFEGHLEVYRIGTEDLCHGIMTRMNNHRNTKNEYSLPSADGCNDLSISEKDAVWLKEDFEVLYRDNTYLKGTTNPEELQEAIEKFYRGGSLHWFVRYECLAEQVDVERDHMRTLDEKAAKLAEKYKTAVITLAHAPGSGGTTLAQSVLWKLHSVYPCVEFKVRSASNIDELSRKIAFLHQKTHMPVIMLVDGEDESKVRYLSRQLKCTILLYVKRYPYSIPNDVPENKVFLGGNVSASEAAVLSAKLGENCDDKQKETLEKMRSEVQSREQDHNLYEFGMTKYHHEFQGIVSFVRGYLQLENNPTRELQPWQRCLGYLALVYYYGQTSIPCQFFAKLINKPPNHIVSLDDFPHAFQQFVVNDRNQGRKNNIRICHYIVAKEILEQILTRHSDTINGRSNRLGLDACRNLAKFCIEFIEYAGGKKTRNSTSSSNISYIIARTFIFRDEKDMGDNEEQKRKKPVLSKVMIDIPAGKPLFTERFRVLEKLTQCFPDDPNFHAHLGRFHAFCRPDEEHQAEQCFQRAIDLCKRHTEGKSVDNIADGMRQTLMHIYHMYGIIKQREIAKYTGRCENERIVNVADKENFDGRLGELVDIAETACSYFKRSRDVTPEMHDNYVYAYTGEIQVRLQISEFIKQHFESERDMKVRITGFLQTSTNSKARKFVKASIPVIENLIMDCYTDVELMAEDVRSLQTSIMWYNHLFKGHVIPIEKVIDGPEDCINNYRLQIAATKLKYGTNNAFCSIEDVDEEKGIVELVRLYEDIFNVIQRDGLSSQYSRKELERDFRDWIYAIRHEKFPKNYKIEDVLDTLQLWKNLIHSPLSVYYTFIMESLLGFGSSSDRGKTECLMEANVMKEELMKLNRLVIRPKYPREWLGENGGGIKRLLPGNRFVGSSVYLEEKEIMCVKPTELLICKGTILRPNTNCVGGFIALDLNSNTVRVFYIPKKADLIGSRFVGRRVEFFLAFSVDNGYEAYGVKLLKTYGCSQCSARVEFTSAESLIFCKCGTPIYKDDLNEVNEKQQQQ